MRLINPGKRALIAGRTGSGKSSLGCWILKNTSQAWIILNPKHTSAYKDLPESIVVESLDIGGITRALEKNRFVIVNPQSRESSPDTLDAFILEIHETWRNIGLCCDELYSLHKGGVAGAGLIGYLTRGRELKQSFLGLTQRPAWLSQFLFSEADYVCGMSLSLQKDRKRMVEMSGVDEFLAKVPPHHWLWYEASTETLKYFLPVPLDD